MIRKKYPKEYKNGGRGCRGLAAGHKAATTHRACAGYRKILAVQNCHKSVANIQDKF
jgi:hypothetical protein